MALDNQKFEDAVKNRDIETALTMLADVSINQEREAARLRKNKSQEIRETRQQKVNEYANSFEGWDFNNWNTRLLALQAGSGMFGLKNKPLGDAGVQFFSAIKSLKDTGTQGTQASLNHALDDLKRTLDESKGDDQRASSAITDFINQIKQLHHMMHEASSQMSRSH